MNNCDKSKFQILHLYIPHLGGCAKMKIVESVTSKLIIEAFFNKVIRFGLVVRWFSIKV
jgi:hypothetical protein